MRLLAHILALFLVCGPALAGLEDKVAATAPSGVVLVLDGKGNTLVAQNEDRSFVPASVAKLVTAWLALEVLGEDYRFQTRFYLDSDRVLYVRGGGDPFLVSEELALLAPALVAATGKAPFTGLVLDASYYPSGLRIPGIEDTGEAYDALNAALAVNFNTIHAVRKGKSVRSAEKQTPITPLAVSQFRERGPNGRGRISLAQEDPDVGVRYAGELLAAFIEQAGGRVEGDVVIGSVPAGLEPVHVHRQSRSLPEILTLLMVGSNNYIANQIFLEIGAHRFGGPVSLEKSQQAAREILTAHGITEGIDLKEGSGISPDNRFSTESLAKVLQAFEPHAALLPKTRAGSRYKTGTIPGVRALAGYVNSSKHGLVPFVISLGGNTGKTRFRLLRTLELGL
ncbi:D-alanyl-D-alanine carboxypeptidase [Roseibium denhamense]|uniref:D-alanyl-D-alanine carboxypeptidase / D-alanyl-D-alanine-endopeptidase (Penicillin-binding protein 4) n=1 Tax=Roseibium denhamense TaxID=76305 RepID=A0ABY1PLY1_9HYPH|nr:D-alanyl-D-alanine carboxypeptidase [Roseibium denhamense]MTI05792.1 D-alanyl-D-alanine carboxypeptidase [Roseibium denhamense]SMP37026.1 D-alanyl-D-alanine carboxypeptidase / D-alanyl-D-alanine-endopeptidase (penicillin-binding protein 4) [Roseibium denhamense]